MSGVNKVIIIGNLGNDPEIKTTPSGQLVAQLSIATSENYTDKSGQRQEKTEWHRVILWEKQAELAEKYLRKGSKLYVEGKLQTRSWEDTATGQKKYATEIIGRTIEFLDSKPQDTAPEPSCGGYGAPAPRQQVQAPVQRQQAPQGRQEQQGGSEYFNDDIPF